MLTTTIAPRTGSPARRRGNGIGRNRYYPHHICLASNLTACYVSLWAMVHADKRRALVEVLRTDRRIHDKLIVIQAWRAAKACFHTLDSNGKL